ncbi:MAG: hypothetical protein JWN86_4028 [Planctomycetota bacterium]|nr:hypothetical protein [Planctomycetota bacterium]
MKWFMSHPLALTVLAYVSMAGRGDAGDVRAARVAVVRTPDGGIQPQAAIDEKGTVHLVYFRGEPLGGDLFYSQMEPGSLEFSAPVRVNSQVSSVVAAGTIRGAQIALGGGRIHVAWNGSGKALPKNAAGSTPMLYTRSNSGRTAFEEQRNLMRKTSVLDGGGTVAADADGNVYVAWHGRTEDAPEGEVGRAMFVARSTDHGATFSGEAPAVDQPTGACACCGTRALADGRGDVFVLYRAATASVNRDMILLTSRDRGSHFQAAKLHPWRINMCPMSSASLARSDAGLVAAWETANRVYFSRIDTKVSKLSPPIAPPGSADRKHPAIAINAKGETLLAWAEGTGWQRGGSLAWQSFDREGRPADIKGRVKDGIPVWSLPTVVARLDGSFLIVH